MKIASYETRAVCLPREPGPPVGGANVAPFVTLTLRTDDGIEGIGYAGFVSDVILKSLHECVNAMAELSIGSDPMNIEAIGKRLRAVGGGSPEGMVTRASAAVDVALWDIKGKALGQPSTSCWAATATGCPPTRAGSCGAPTTWKRLPRQRRGWWRRGTAP